MKTYLYRIEHTMALGEDVLLIIDMQISALLESLCEKIGLRYAQITTGSFIHAFLLNNRKGGQMENSCNKFGLKKKEIYQGIKIQS